MINNLTPKQTFIGGIIGGFLVLASIGFFVLLGVMLSGSSKVNDMKEISANQVVKQPSAPEPNQPQAPSEITLTVVSEDDYIRGNEGAKITIVEYSDTECPFCKRFHGTMQQVMEEYKGDVRWVYRHAPLDSLHRKARKEAEALECAGELGGNEKFWEYADRLYAITPSNDGLLASQLPEIASYVGLNEIDFNECLDSGRFAQAVQDDLSDATRAGLRGTPYSVLIVGDQKIPISGAYPFAQMKAIIDQVL